MASSSDHTASLMTPAKLRQAAERRAAAAVSPSAYLDQMAADAGHQHLRRLAELGVVLQTHAGARQAQAPREALAARTPWLTALCRDRGYRFAPRLHRRMPTSRGATATRCSSFRAS